MASFPFSSPDLLADSVLGWEPRSHPAVAPSSPTLRPHKPQERDFQESSVAQVSTGPGVTEQNSSQAPPLPPTHEGHETGHFLSLVPHVALSVCLWVASRNHNGTERQSGKTLRGSMP